MAKGCSTEGCNEKHLAKGKCRYHYRMPSRKKSLIEQAIKPMNDLVYAQAKIRATIDKAKPKKEPSVKELLKLAEIVFNRWIRHRDKLTDRTFKCISCGEFKPLREMDAGHFFPKTFSALRFNEDNVHGECKSDNQFNDKHLKQYEVNLKEKIGLERFNLLLENYNKPVKWSKEELLEIIAKYK